MKKVLLAISGLLLSQTLIAQGFSDYGSGIKLNINQDGSKYIRVITWNQIWLRNTQNNPGSAVGGVPEENSWSIGNRRLRMLAMAQISKRFTIVTHFGINNQTFINGGAAGTSGTGGYGQGKKPGMFFHDAWNEYAVVQPTEKSKFSLSIGAGLHYYTGLSRATMASTLNFMLVDAQIFNWPLIDNSDQFARQMGLFAKGKWDRLEYRFSLNKPFATNLTPVNATSDATAIAVDNNGNSKWSKGGYVEYQFLDIESNALPYKVGTYLGTKKVFNIGAGFYHQGDGTRSMVNGITSKHDITLLSADVFAELPVGDKSKNMAINVYGVYYNYNFGPNYLRNLGIMNIATSDTAYTGSRAIAGAGNLQPTIGTGSIAHVQAGFMLPCKNPAAKLRIQSFGAATYKQFKALEHASTQFDVGANWLISGHHAKITTQYSTRPVYTSTTAKPTSKGELTVQFQVYL